MNIPVNMSTEELDLCAECKSLVYVSPAGLLDIRQNGPWYADTEAMHAHQPVKHGRTPQQATAALHLEIAGQDAANAERAWHQTLSALEEAVRHAHSTGIPRADVTTLASERGTLEPSTSVRLPAMVRRIYS